MPIKSVYGVFSDDSISIALTRELENGFQTLKVHGFALFKQNYNHKWEMSMQSAQCFLPMGNYPNPKNLTLVKILKILFLENVQKIFRELL